MANLIYERDEEMAEIKTDCFAYDATLAHRHCTALEELYCQKGQCNFYKTKIQREREKLEQERQVFRR